MATRELSINDQIITTESDLNAVRRPVQVFTDGYLNDPIQFAADSRFEPATVVQQFSGLPSQIQRDFADFVQIDRNQPNPQLMTLNMFSNLVDRNKYNASFIDRTEFSQF